MVLKHSCMSVEDTTKVTFRIGVTEVTLTKSTACTQKLCAKEGPITPRNSRHSQDKPPEPLQRQAAHVSEPRRAQNVSEPTKKTVFRAEESKNSIPQMWGARPFEGWWSSSLYIRVKRATSNMHHVFFYGLEAHEETNQKLASRPQHIAYEGLPLQ